MRLHLWNHHSHDVISENIHVFVVVHPPVVFVSQCMDNIPQFYQYSSGDASARFSLRDSFSVYLW